MRYAALLFPSRGFLAIWFGHGESVGAKRGGAQKQFSSDEPMRHEAVRQLKFVVSGPQLQNPDNVR
jgi:hypothetical protein